MSEDSVNVESRTSSQDKRWTIMAALLGTNTALLLFQGIEQARDPVLIREVALAIIAAALPFQAIYFLVYTFVLEHEQRLPAERLRKLELASALCQVVSYASLVASTGAMTLRMRRMARNEEAVNEMPTHEERLYHIMATPTNEA